MAEYVCDNPPDPGKKLVRLSVRVNKSTFNSQKAKRKGGKAFSD